jgi:hypothetical protein
MSQTNMLTVYAVFPADYAASEQAVAIFADRTDAQFFIYSCEEAERDFSARLIIQEWDVSNLDFMAAS